MDPVDAIGVLADTHVRALLLAERGLSVDAIAARLDVPAEAVPHLLEIARAKLAALEPDAR